MFGLNDTQDKNNAANGGTPAADDALAAIDSGLSSVALPPNDSPGSVTTPVVEPGSEPAPAPAPAALEAVPSAAVAAESVSPPTAEATMPDLATPAETPHLDTSFLDNGSGTDENTKTKSNQDKPVLTGNSEEQLLDIKQQALRSLTPLVDQLDQAPEEKFKTVMMLIQASDNSEMVKEAYAAANEITDEKVRAQALLDVVNEINYFTQHQQDNAGSAN